MNLTILSPEKEIFSGDVKSVKVPGSAGQFEMLDNHAPIVASLAKGEIRVLTDKGEKVVFNVEGGFVEMLNNEVSLLVSSVRED
ncbi:MAG: ATP synthase F1 subunit epsilon [Saprospiraceae bacterium]|nr:ATP synthase F1 subunit epsilon [Saprospiraceae bacterium]MCB9307585.1 ATP synthase F1 subunit epsilon [Lewinellaceae bacterium]MCB9354547.1 ATP synthase F1 subunit epsilon [Lewinellaceae bacterium]